MKTIGLGLAALALATVFAGEAAAQQYPSRPVKILVTIPPGGAPDIAARLLAQRLTETMGQSFFVENRPGANGNVAADAVAKGEPDGHTLILGADSLITINPHVYPSLPYDPLKDLLPVASVASNQFFLSVNPGLPVKTVPELVEYARKANPPIAYASGGNGSQHQLGIEMLKQRAGIDMLHVPYRGGSPAGTATVAGETMVVLAGASNAGLLQGGQLRGLATTGTKRSPLFPDLPPIADFLSGLRPHHLARPLRAAGDARADRDQAAHRGAEGAARARVRAEAQRHRRARAADPLARRFRALIRRDYDKYGKLVRDVGVKIQ